MAMSRFEFAFVASGIDPEEEFEDRFFDAGCQDATLAFMNGRLVALFAREAESYAHAVHSAYRAMIEAGATVERFEPDYLVNRNEIAARCIITKQAVSLYASNQRGAGFPAPVARVTTKSPLWDWVEVARWFHDKGKLPLAEVEHARIGRAVNLHLVATRAVPVPERLFMDDLSKVLAGGDEINPCTDSSPVPS